MGLDQLFMTRQPLIRQLFERIGAENDLFGDRAATLEFTNTESSMLFLSVPSVRRVKPDWRGISALNQPGQAIQQQLFNGWPFYLKEKSLSRSLIT
jgi:hypothetical protein